MLSVRLILRTSAFPVEADMVSFANALHSRQIELTNNES